MSQNTQAAAATKSKFSVRDICYAGLFAAVIAVMAQISIPMPLGVPMTMQTFAITLAAVVLGSKLSAIATLVYLALGAVGGLLRLTRSAMLETLREDYIRTARAKGASETRIIFHHALKNALMPVITNIGMTYGAMLGGAVITETVFNIPGLGLYIVTAIRTKDIPVVMGCVILIAVAYSVVMLIVDIIYAYIDPRIKAKYVEG